MYSRRLRGYDPRIARSPTDKVHNLQPVPRLQPHLAPGIPRSDLAITLDRNPIRLQTQLTYQISQRCIG